MPVPKLTSRDEVAYERGDVLPSGIAAESKPCEHLATIAKTTPSLQAGRPKPNETVRRLLNQTHEKQQEWDRVSAPIAPSCPAALRLLGPDAVPSFVSECVDASNKEYNERVVDRRGEVDPDVEGKIELQIEGWKLEMRQQALGLEVSTASPALVSTKRDASSAATSSSSSAASSRASKKSRTTESASSGGSDSDGNASNSEEEETPQHVSVAGRSFKELKHGAQKKRRRVKIPPSSVELLSTWFRAHVHHPYPTEDQKETLKSKANLDEKQIVNWFTNTRKRFWYRHPHDPHLNRLSTERVEKDLSLPPPMAVATKQPQAKATAGSSRKAKSRAAATEDD